MAIRSKEVVKRICVKRPQKTNFVTAGSVARAFWLLREEKKKIRTVR